MEALLLGIAVGFFAGVIPGAFSTVVATTALERGMGPGLKVALIPLATETFVMLVAVLILTQLPETTLRWIGIGGGTLLLFIGWKVLRESGERSPLEGPDRDHGGHYARVALFGVASPGPWAFWFFVGAPLLLSRWYVSPGRGLAFLGGFMVCFIGVMLALAWGVASGRERLSLSWYQRVLKGAGVLLLVLGAVLVWQSWVGNFTEFVLGPEALERRLDTS